MAAVFQSSIELDDAWVEGGPALVVVPETATSAAAGVVTTSDCTVVVSGTSYTGGTDPGGMGGGGGAVPLPGQPTYQLWMYGVGAGSVAAAVSGTGVSSQPLRQTANILATYLPAPLKAGQLNIAYAVSNTVRDPGLVKGAAAYAFDLSFSYYPLISTAIPSQTEPRSFDGHDASMANYKDAHVLELKKGRGWLMLLARYTAIDGDYLFGPGAAEGKGIPGPDNSSAAIVGYWCSDPSFQKDIKGPYFLVARYHDNFDGVNPDQVPLWIGVPAACEIEVDGVEYLYIYYAAELTDYANSTEWGPDRRGNFIPGTHVKRIPTEHLPWGNTWGRAVALYMGWYYLTSTYEPNWNSKSGLHEVAGEKLGKVNIWVAEGRPWKAGDSPATKGNRLIWDVYVKLKDVDAVPVVFDESVALYFAGNLNEEGTGTQQYAWGIWRSVLGPAAKDRVYGTDFVVRTVTDADLGGKDDLVARSNPTNTVAHWSGNSQMRLDPDPVPLPSGEWLVFAGSEPAEELKKLGYKFPLERFATTQDTAERSFSAAW